PYGMGTGGSRVMANAGPAVAQTAREVRVKATRVAAELLECAPEDVRIAEGRVHVAGVPSRALPLGRVAHAALRSKALKGVGERGSIAPAAAIANAVEDAVADLGVVIREVPVTPARLFAALRDARR